jgi:predicted transcriptional regulator
MLKDDVKQMIDKLPDDCSMEDIQYTLYVKSKIQKGQKDIEEGNFISHDEVKKRMDKWFDK